jgi:hypothetical protein
MKGLGFRFWFGFCAAVVLLVILGIHLIGQVKLDNAALALVGGTGAALAFAMSEQLGITRITAFHTTIEFAKEAAKAIPKEQRGQIYDVLRNNEDLFPMFGARVLWVDDEPKTLIPHRQVLRRLGVQVISVTSTDKAIAEAERDPDFALVIQDRLRNDEEKDAIELNRWVSTTARKDYKLLAPLVVYSFDQFDPSIGVKEEDWITRDFSKLLNRVILELRDWHDRIPEFAPDKPLS